VEKPVVAAIQNQIDCINGEPTCNRGGSGSGGAGDLPEGGASTHGKSPHGSEQPHGDEGLWDKLKRKAGEAWDGTKEGFRHLGTYGGITSTKTATWENVGGNFYRFDLPEKGRSEIYAIKKVGDKLKIQKSNSDACTYKQYPGKGQ
jgi:hypothetical protein